jgi:hypothetical protein
MVLGANCEFITNIYIFDLQALKLTDEFKVMA